jgi:hypothetical protein
MPYLLKCIARGEYAAPKPITCESWEMAFVGSVEPDDCSVAV